MFFCKPSLCKFRNVKCDFLKKTLAKEGRNKQTLKKSSCSVRKKNERTKMFIELSIFQALLFDFFFIFSPTMKKSQIFQFCFYSILMTSIVSWVNGSPDVTVPPKKGEIHISRQIRNLDFTDFIT